MLDCDYNPHNSLHAALAFKRNSELQGGDVTIADGTARALCSLGAQGASFTQSSKRYDVLSTTLNTREGTVQWTLSIYQEDTVTLQQLSALIENRDSKCTAVCSLRGTTQWNRISFAHSKTMLWFPQRNVTNALPTRGLWFVRTSTGDTLHGAYDFASLARTPSGGKLHYSIPLYNKALTSTYISHRLAVATLRLVISSSSSSSTLKWTLHTAGIELNLAPTLGDFVYPRTLSVRDALDSDTFEHNASSVPQIIGLCADELPERVFTSERSKQDLAGSLADVLREAFGAKPGQVIEAAASFIGEAEAVEFYVDVEGTGKMGVPPSDRPERPRFTRLVDALYMDALHDFIAQNNDALCAEVARLSKCAPTAMMQHATVYTSEYGYEALYNLVRRTTESPPARALAAAYKRRGFRAPTLAELMSGGSGLPMWLSRPAAAVFADLMSDTLGAALNSLEQPDRAAERARFERLMCDLLATTVPVFAPNTGYQPSAVATSLLQLVFEASTQMIEKRARTVFNMPTATVRGSVLGEAVSRALVGSVATGSAKTMTMCSIEAPLREVCAALCVLAKRVVLYPTFIEQAASARVFVDSALRRETATAADLAVRIEASGPVGDTVFVHASRVLPASAALTVYSPRALDHYTYSATTADDGNLNVWIVDALSGGVFALRTRRTEKSTNALTAEMFDGVVRKLVTAARVIASHVRDNSMSVLNTVSRHAVDATLRSSEAADNSSFTAAQRTAAAEQEHTRLRALIDKHFIGVPLVSPFGVALSENATQTVTWLDATKRDELVFTVSQGNNTSVTLPLRFDSAYGECGAYRLSDAGEQGEWRNAVEFAVVQQKMVSQEGEPVIEVPLMATVGYIALPSTLLESLIREQSVRIDRARKAAPTAALATQAIRDPFGDYSLHSGDSGHNHSPLLLRADTTRSDIIADPVRCAAIAGAPLHTDAHTGPAHIEHSILGHIVHGLYGLFHAPYYYYDEYYTNPVYQYGPGVYSHPYYGGYYGHRYRWSDRPKVIYRKPKVIVQKPAPPRDGNRPLGGPVHTRKGSRVERK